MPTTTTKLWGGRFTTAPNKLMEKYNSSFSYDKRLWAEDLIGSKAYATALEKSKLLTTEERDSIHSGLDLIKTEWETKSFVEANDEDIHTAHERRLTELIGPDIAGKLHTGRSRNDQVATDLRLYIRNVIQQEIMPLLHGLISVMTEQSFTYISVLMPGFTHLQVAQPIRFSHWLLSHATSLFRDVTRLSAVLTQATSACPLGSGALAGNAFNIDRSHLASELGFTSISLNSLDAVSDRDTVSDFCYVASLIMVHLSQLSEDLIVYNTLKGITISDEYSTGSSLMPQKKNPDACELLRGKTGRVIGNLSGFLSTLKGLPRSYNKDLQEDKEALFDTIDTVRDCLAIATGVVGTLSPNVEILKSLLVPEMLATDLAEFLVRRGVPFRETHHIAGAAVKMAESKGVSMSSLSREDLASLHPLFDCEEVLTVLSDYEASVERKSVPGGTAKEAVLRQIDFLQDWLKKQ